MIFQPASERTIRQLRYSLSNGHETLVLLIRAHGLAHNHHEVLSGLVGFGRTSGQAHGGRCQSASQCGGHGDDTANTMKEDQGKPLQKWQLKPSSPRQSSHLELQAGVAKKRAGLIRPILAYPEPAVHQVPLVADCCLAPRFALPAPRGPNQRGQVVGPHDIRGLLKVGASPPSVVCHDFDLQGGPSVLVDRPILNMHQEEPLVGQDVLPVRKPQLEPTPADGLTHAGDNEPGLFPQFADRSVGEAFSWHQLAARRRPECTAGQRSSLVHEPEKQKTSGGVEDEQSRR